MPGILYVVATPIGNLEDITFRAIRVLREVAVIAAEDTRRTARLLQHYSISTPTTSLHEHNERARTPALISRLAAWGVGRAGVGCRNAGRLGPGGRAGRCRSRRRHPGRAGSGAVSGSGGGVRVGAPSRTGPVRRLSTI